VKGTIHWVSVAHAIKAEVRLYDRLFKVEDPAAEEDFRQLINPDSLQIVTEAYLEPSLKDTTETACYQFIRKGYFCLDKKLSSPGNPIFNRTVTLKDNWAKVSK
jgi:glutaminyl-tRNA synthetase